MIRLSITVLIMFVVYGCTDEKPTEVTEIISDYCEGCFDESVVGTDLIPLAEGNEWVYKYNKYDTLGNPVTIDSTVRIWVSGHSDIINGIEYYPIAYRSLGGSSYSHVYARNSVEGFCVGYPISSHRYLYRLYKYPAVPGERYNNTDNYPQTFGSQILWLVDESEQISVEAGSYDCMFYAGYPRTCSGGDPSVYYAAPLSPIWGCYPMAGLSGREYLWYETYISPGIGVIKKEIYILKNGVRKIQEWELQDFTIHNIG